VEWKLFLIAGLLGWPEILRIGFRELTGFQLRDVLIAPLFWKLFIDWKISEEGIPWTSTHFFRRVLRPRGTEALMLPLCLHG